MNLLLSESSMIHWPYYEQLFAQLAIQVNVQHVAKIDARLLRKQTDFCLVIDEQGLSLAKDGMQIQPNWCGQLPRLKRATIKNELLARACRIQDQPLIIDATAGLGHDGLLLAWLGAQVMMLERHPILFALLKDSQTQAKRHTLLAPVVEKIQLIHTDANTYFTNSTHVKADVIYLDPMFPKSAHKQAQVKKDMQVLHQLLHCHTQAIDLGDALLPLAQQIARRVIVKRPRHAHFLNEQVPQHQWQGDACRFDGYFQPQYLIESSNDKINAS